MYVLIRSLPAANRCELFTDDRIVQWQINAFNSSHQHGGHENSRFPSDEALSSEAVDQVLFGENSEVRTSAAKILQSPREGNPVCYNEDNRSS